METDITYKDIIDQFGTERQCRQAMEECAELIQAINKALRYPNNSSTRLQLIEEIADVKIMIMQLEEIFDITWKEASHMFEYKKVRLIKKYLEEKHMAERRKE